MTELIGGRYIAGERVGSGGTATVYRARDRELGRDVALKVFHPRLANDPVLRARVRSEVDLMRSLDHPGIAEVYDLVDDADTVAIAMEYLPGGDLRRLILQAGGIATETVNTMATAMARALAYAHAAGVIHRDIKPRNILFTGSGEPRLTDFGLARSASTAGLTERDSVAGTAEYTAPETITSSLWDARSDLYSLGATLFEALTGSPPFTANSPAEVLRMQVEHEIPDLPESVRRSDPSLSIAVTALLAKDPNDRPQTAGELEQLLAGSPRGLVRSRTTITCPSCGAQMSSVYGWCFHCGRPNIHARHVRRQGYALLVTGPGSRGEKITPEARDACANLASRYGLSTDRLKKSVPRLPFVLARHLDRAGARRIASELALLSVETTVVGPGEERPSVARSLLFRKTLTMAPRIYLVALGSMGGVWPTLANANWGPFPLVIGGVLAAIPVVTHLSFSRPLTTLDPATDSGDPSRLEEMLGSVSDPLVHARVQGIVEAGAALERASVQDQSLPDDVKALVRDTVRQARERAATLGMALADLEAGTRLARRTMFVSPAGEPSERDAVALARRNDQLCNRALEAMGTAALEIHELAVRLAGLEGSRAEGEIRSLRESLTRLDDLTSAWSELAEVHA
jgi:tRNA A-37 threonylcarbamoyl transferase component Bud32